MDYKIEKIPYWDIQDSDYRVFHLKNGSRNLEMVWSDSGRIESFRITDLDTRKIVDEGHGRVHESIMEMEILLYKERLSEDG